MARAWFGQSAADFVSDTIGGGLVRMRSADLTFYDAPAGGTRITDLLYNGVAVDHIAVPASGIIPRFQGPDAVYSMWADAGSGMRTQIIALGDAANFVGISQREQTGGVAGLDGNGFLYDARIPANVPRKGVTGTFNVYLSPTGSDTNDGLSAATPFRTFQKAFDYLATQGAPKLQGNWNVWAAAGTYTAPSDYGTTKRFGTVNVESDNPIIVRGPSVGGGVPTAILDGTASTAINDHAHGLSAGFGTNVEFRDLKFINFNGDTAGDSRTAVLGEYAERVHFNNCHVNGATWCGTYMFSCFRAYVTDGIYENCRYGINPNYTELTVQAGSAGGTLVKTATAAGVYWSRGSQGHLDNAIIQDSAIGLWAAENSRVDTVSDNFKRNTLAVKTTTGGYFGEGGTSTNIYNDGTADANTQKWDFGAASGYSNDLETSKSWTTPGTDSQQHSGSGTTVTTLSTPLTIKAGRLDGNGKMCRVIVRGTITATAAGSKLLVLFGGMTHTLTLSAAVTGIFYLEVTLMAYSAGYRANSTFICGTLTNTGTSTSGFDKTVDNAVVVKCQGTAAGDSTVTYMITAELIG